MKLQTKFQVFFVSLVSLPVFRLSLYMYIYKYVVCAVCVVCVV